MKKVQFMTDSKLTLYLEQFVTEKRKALFKEVLDKRTRHFTVAIEDIYQPHNASAVVRSCDIFGIQDIHIIENKYEFNATNQVAKGAQKWVDFTYYKEKGNNNTASCIDALRKAGYQIVATTPHTNSTMLQDFDISKKSAFFFGVEKEGLSDEVMNKADIHLKIPMVGFTESLNISVAAAIVLQHLQVQLEKSKVNWQLSHAEKEQLYLAWLEKSIKSIKKIKDLYFKEVSSG